LGEGRQSPRQLPTPSWTKEGKGYGELDEDKGMWKTRGGEEVGEG